MVGALSLGRADCLWQVKLSSKARFWLGCVIMPIHLPLQLNNHSAPN
jgi:hypothetical protein